MSNHIQSAHKLISSFISLLRTPKQKTPTPDLPPTTTFLPQQTMMMSSNVNTKITTISDSQQWVANQTVMRKKLNVVSPMVDRESSQQSYTALTSEYDRNLLRDFTWNRVIGNHKI